MAGGYAGQQRTGQTLPCQAPRRHAGITPHPSLNRRCNTRQLLRSGTSIGANVEEAIGGQSRADFIAKLAVAYKEARETSYWLRLLRDTGYLPEAEFNGIHADAEELCRIIGAIQKTTKSKPRITNS